MTPDEYGRMLAAQTPPITAEQAAAAARILYEVMIESQQLAPGNAPTRVDEESALDGVAGEVDPKPHLA